MAKQNFTYRDVSTILQKIREFLLGRKHILHGRFTPVVAPRTIPPPDIPRGVGLKYSDQFYFKRSAMDSVKPPVVAPVALGSNLKRGDSGRCTGAGQNISFTTAPTPGPAWWWDGHCYYECTRDDPVPKKTSSSTCTVEPHCGGKQSSC